MPGSIARAAGNDPLVPIAAAAIALALAAPAAAGEAAAAAPEPAETCVPCHEKTQATDLVFTRYAP